MDPRIIAIDDGGPAFPTVPINHGYGPEDQGFGIGAGAGLSLRDYFAAHAPPVPTIAAEAYLDSLKINEPEAMEIPWNGWVLERLAVQERRWRYAYADAMIAGRNKPV